MNLIISLVNLLFIQHPMARGLPLNATTLNLLSRHDSLITHFKNMISPWQRQWPDPPYEVELASDHSLMIFKYNAVVDPKCKISFLDSLRYIKLQKEDEDRPVYDEFNAYYMNRKVGMD